MKIIDLFQSKNKIIEFNYGKVPIKALYHNLNLLWKRIVGYIFTKDNYSIKTKDGFVIKCKDQ